MIFSQLTFSQRVALGFGFIVLLLTISSLSSMWNLNTIHSATGRVNDTAVPIVKESNRVQIQILKLANLSALAFNATTIEETEGFRNRFLENVKEFNSLYDELREITKDDSSTRAAVAAIREDYDAYEKAILEMFDSKIFALTLDKKIKHFAYELVGFLDEVGGVLADIQYYEADDEFKKLMEETAGTATRCDDLLISLVNTIEEIQNSNSLKKVENLQGSIEFSWRDVEHRMGRASESLLRMGAKELVRLYKEKAGLMNQRVSQKPDIITMKVSQIKKMETMRAKLDEGNAAIAKAVTGLDALLQVANSQFNNLQGQVNTSVDFGFQSSIVLFVILLGLVALNFNSMRKAIARKVNDLARLNRIGRNLSQSPNQQHALEEVLQAMHKKIGVDYGSVYLLNENDDFQAMAYFPPKANVPDKNKTLTFAMGEGILGMAAEKKRIVFVANTATDKNFKNNDDAPRSLLCVPLMDKDILIGVINLSGDIKKVHFAESDYSFVASITRSLVTQIKNIRMREEIEEANRNLEKKVEERTAALAQKNRDIATMMSNLHQGLFTITPGGVIHPEYSLFLESIFETSNIANRNFADLLFEHAKISEDIKDQIITSVASIVGEDEMMYEFNSHLLGSTLELSMPDTEAMKLLELDWKPIIGHDIVEKLMVTVRDVTELKALEAQAQAQQEELKIIGEILSIDNRKFEEFIEGAFKYTSMCADIIEKHAFKDLSAIAELFRNIHTVKGNARTYGFLAITEVTHQVEQKYDELRKDESVPWEPVPLREELEQVFDILKVYKGVYNDKLGGGSGKGGANVQLDKDKVNALLQKINAIGSEDVPSSVRRIVSDTFETLIGMQANPVSEVLADIVISVNSLAKELGKSQPAIAISDNNVLIKQEIHSVLNDIFMHIFRNSIDHGIEADEERLANSKEAFGTITVNTVIRDDKADIEISDNGRGLALKKILEKAQENGVFAEGDSPSDLEVGNVIFSSGVSTAQAVTEVSGRGVGLDAAKGFIESQGGGITIVFTDDNEGGDFRSFKTVVTIPNQFFLIPPQFEKIA